MLEIMTATHLGSEIESQMPALSQSVFNQQRNLCRETQANGVREASCLAKVCQILEREGEGNWFG